MHTYRVGLHHGCFSKNINKYWLSALPLIIILATFLLAYWQPLLWEKDGFKKDAYVGFSWTTFFFGFWVPSFRLDLKGFLVFLGIILT